MSTTPDRRFTFNAAAADYNAARPAYPEALIEDILRIAAVPPNGSILEVGCGTGQATLPFAKRGFSMLCLDIGADLLALAARKCHLYPRVRFLCQAFEDWQPGQERFDLLLSATAFHWIPPALGYPKAAGFLKDTGFIALIWNYHPKPYTKFFVEVQEIYRQWVPEWPDPDLGPSLEDDLHSTETEINQTGLFAPLQVKTYSWAKDYSSMDYLRLLNTYSDHHMLEENRKLGLFGDIRKLIDERYGGKITRPYLTALFLALKNIDHHA
jgi:SAM-dependent methyltransferase